MREKTPRDWLAAIPDLLEGKRFYLALAVVLLAGLILRTLYLEADPPAGITRSQDFSTDPFAYTMFAKNKVDVGNANPYNDQRWILYERSTQTVAALAVYSILGTGRAAGNFVAVILNILAICFLALGIKNFGSRLGAIGFAALATANYTMIFFGRTPFLEASQNFWLCTAFYLFSLGEKRNLFFTFAGIATAAAAFFGKMLALSAAGVFLAVFLLQLIASADERERVARRAGSFFVGYFAVALVWLVFSYLPHVAEVKYYLQEQGLGLYGAPKGLQSLSGFLWQFQNLLWESEFVEKLHLIVALGGIFGAIVVAGLVRTSIQKSSRTHFNVGWTVLLLWFLVSYVTLFPWNYRPLRYQTTLMFPLMAMAALLLAYPWELHKTQEKKDKKDKSSVRFVYIAIPVALWLAPIIGAGILELGDTGNPGRFPNEVLSSILLYSLLFVGIGFGLSYLIKFFGGGKGSWRRWGRYSALLVVFLYVLFNVLAFRNWAEARQYSLITSDRDLAGILNKDAVISGSYAVALTQENKLSYVHHMFSMKYDPDFFRTYPITHLIMDAGNEERARKDYPQIMNGADLITTYVIRGVPVKLYRISEVSPNERARAYRPSDLEMARYWINRDNNDSAKVYFNRYLAQEIPNYTADFFLGSAYLSAGQPQDAIPHFLKVKRFAPADPAVSANLGYAYINAMGMNNNPAYLDTALIYFKEAQRYFPNDKKLAEMVDQLEKRK